MHEQRLQITGDNAESKMWRGLAVTVVFVASGLAQAFPRPASGSIDGTVVDNDGNPLAAATVFVGTLAKGPRATTDADGRFTLNDVPAGTVGLQAYKESDGYPYNMFSFYLMPGEQLTKCDVPNGERVSNVVIHLGPKAAYLRIKITDENGLPVGASLAFSRPDLGQYGDYRRSAKADDVILVPPLPFRLTVEAKGFEPWHYGAERWRARDGLIDLKSAETLTLAIRLKRSE